MTRLAALEARGGKRASLGQMLYLPVIFFAYGVLLGERVGLLVKMVNTRDLDTIPQYHTLTQALCTTSLIILSW